MAVAAREMPVTGGGRSPELVAVPRSTGPSLVLLGSLVVLVGLWGAVAPYVGPLFGFSPDGASAWHWSRAHALLALAPGGVAAVAGVLLLTAVGRATAGRGRIDVGLLGFVVALCGAWFVIGQFAWPVLFGGSYLLGASSLHYLLEQLAFAVGTGTVLVGCGAFAMGWAARHHRRPPLLEEDPAGTGRPPAAPVRSTLLSPMPSPVRADER